MNKSLSLIISWINICKQILHEHEKNGCTHTHLFAHGCKHLKINGRPHTLVFHEHNVCIHLYMDNKYMHIYTPDACRGGIQRYMKENSETLYF